MQVKLLQKEITSLSWGCSESEEKDRLLFRAGGWTGWSSEVSSNPNYSITLWFYLRFPSPPLLASPCRRSEAGPCQREPAVPVLPWHCVPTSTHTTIIPAFYSTSSAIPLDPLHLSRPLSSLTSSFLSPLLCIPKYTHSLPWLLLVSPVHRMWLGRRQDKQ